MAKPRRMERFWESALRVSAVMSLILLVLIAMQVVVKGWPALQYRGAVEFITGTVWHPFKEIFGIMPMIVGTAVVTGGALLLGVPLGLATATFLAFFAPKAAAFILRPAVKLLAGIPSVIYGLFGMTFIVPQIRNWAHAIGLPPQDSTGFSILAASFVLAIMVLPTIISVGEDALRAVPEDYLVNSLALGSTRWQGVWNVVIPAARTGVVAAVILGLGRALGETMAVLMVVGNTAVFPRSVFSPVRTLTSNIALEFGYAHGLHLESLFATGIVLFIVILFLNWLATILGKGASKYHASS